MPQRHLLSAHVRRLPVHPPALQRGRRPHPWSTLVWRGPRPGLVKRLCEDSCAGFTRNGVCDEGRPTLPYRALWRRQQDPAQSVYQVYCDLGTDCGDCGTWVRPALPAGALPIAAATHQTARCLRCGCRLAAGFTPARA